MPDQDYGDTQSFEQHLYELKSSLKHIAIVSIFLTAFFFLISDNILQFMQQDLEVGLHGLSPFEVLNVRIAMAAIFGIVLSIPVILYSLIKFAEPGLTKKEYRILRNSLPFSYLLFIGGSVFAYQVVFRNAVNFFIEFTQGANIEVVWGLQNTLMLGLRISLITGFLFQLPLLVVILKKAGLVTIDQLKEYRPYVIVAVLLIAAFATPPDLITQVFITVPIILLYEISIKIAKYA